VIGKTDCVTLHASSIHNRQERKLGDIVTPFFGSLAECVEQYRSNAGETANQMLASICEVTLDTARSWGPDRLPNGEVRNKLRIYLSERGYDTIELVGCHPVVKVISALVAFDYMTTADAMELLSYTKEQSLWHALSGKSVPVVVSNGALTLQDLQEKYYDSLSRLKSRRFFRGLEWPGLRPQAASDAIRPADPPPPNPPTVHEPFEALQAASYLLASLPFLRACADDPELRNAVRRLLGDEDFYGILDLLKSMSSREAQRWFSDTTVKP
jgi:hypothetical protein